jgi:hypothetical protein
MLDLLQRSGALAQRWRIEPKHRLNPKSENKIRRLRRLEESRRVMERFKPFRCRISGLLLAGNSLNLWNLSNLADRFNFGVWA